MAVNKVWLQKQVEVVSVLSKRVALLEAEPRWSHEKACECLVRGGAGDEGDDECRASKGKRK